MLLEHTENGDVPASRTKRTDNGRTLKVYHTWHADRDAMPSGYCGWLGVNKQNYASLT